MSTDDRIRNRTRFRRPLVWIGLIMTIFYVVLGTLLLLHVVILPGIDIDFQHIFAVMLLVYGLYRGWRVIADYF